MDREEEKMIANAITKERAAKMDACCGQVGKFPRPSGVTEEPRPKIWDDPCGWSHDITRHHAPSGEGIALISAVRAAADSFINEILRSCPECGDRQQAIIAARTAMMFANAAIALEGRA